MLIRPKTSLILRENRFFYAKSAGYLRVFELGSPKFTVSSSLGSVLTSGNVIAAAAAAGPGSAHGAVTSAITQVAVTAVAIASGACLSTKVDCLWPKMEEQPGSLIFDGVDVTGYPIFNDKKVQKAIAFARKAHCGQTRMTGDPYVSHCIHTGKILAALVPPTGKRAIDTIVGGILHDVVDDTCESFDSIGQEFDSDVAKLVAGVSRLSYVNQLLRRHRRMNVTEGTLSADEANNLRVMLLGMVDDARVVLIKLADRLHNMRTIYALPHTKAKAVAEETLAIWCSLASKLGLWALKAELEDLCFAVLQPKIFFQLRDDLACMWSTNTLRRITVKSSYVERFPECLEPAVWDEETVTMKVLLQAVHPFDLLSDRKKREVFINNLMRSSDTPAKPKVVRDAGIALASLVVCEEALERELFISTSYIPGMEVTLSGRLKSLYSVYNKMKRKDVGLAKVYDARALRVIIGDNNGTLHGQAVKCCYDLLNIIQRLWTPIDGEFDDYIVNPKPSGYQSLHTAVQGPDHFPVEVQIRTQKMHECAEHGLAAHWLYKEADIFLPARCSAVDSSIEDSLDFCEEMDDQSTADDAVLFKYSSLKAGHPVLRVEAGHLLSAVIVRVDKDGQDLLVAVSFGLAAYEAVADRRSTYKMKRWEAYAYLYKKVSDEWWFEPGHGDWSTCLEKYTLCTDGIYHKQDQFQRLLPTFIQVIELTEREESGYWNVVSAVFEGKPIDSHEHTDDEPIVDSNLGFNPDAYINKKVQLLRTMLCWEEQLRCEVGFRQFRSAELSSLKEVAIVCWPRGGIMRLATGSTAADAATRVGLDGNLVSVNGQLVLPNTELKDGDVVEVRM